MATKAIFILTQGEIQALASMVHGHKFARGGFLGQVVTGLLT